MTIDSERVTAMLIDCLFKDDELPADVTEETLPETAVVVDGVINRFALHRERLELHRDEVRSMLDQLPTGFHKSGGGGWSFLQACVDKDDVQWTSFHVIMDQLFVLGQGLGYVSYLMPRDMWSALPGGMPYIVIDTTRKDAA